MNKDSLKYFSAVMLGFMIPLFIISGMQYSGYTFFFSFNALICGMLAGMSMIFIYLLAPDSTKEVEE